MTEPMDYSNAINILRSGRAYSFSRMNTSDIKRHDLLLSLFFYIALVAFLVPCELFSLIVSDPSQPGTGTWQSAVYCDVIDESKG